MSDFVWGQINACNAEYRALVLLCWWHVLHTWQQHFKISLRPELWELLKRWIRIVDHDIIPMWSAVYRKNLKLSQNRDTNMLIEAWHHILKTKFLQGKRNRRADHLLNIIVNEDLGFEGIDAEVTVVNQYRVKSRSKPSYIYVVDISAYTCTCLDYPLILYCKNIAAVQTLLKEVVTTTVLPGTKESPSSDPGSTNEEVDSSSDTVSHADNDSPDDEPPYPHQIQPPPTTRNLTLLARRLDTLAARLRHSRVQESSFPSLAAVANKLYSVGLFTVRTGCRNHREASEANLS
ncbi:hypothetical protein R3P38DRAFT_3206828 [Favolaschia claudopus]|uniref:SWIM-type domain-containing protein n=1 Tax=Favolaschia claudopus TaxID=2862362 RepID=A0AAW0AL19_9AGAR